MVIKRSGTIVPLFFLADSFFGPTWAGGNKLIGSLFQPRHNLIGIHLAVMSVKSEDGGRSLCNYERNVALSVVTGRRRYV
jgi:hypothetical protein